MAQNKSGLVFVTNGSATVYGDSNVAWSLISVGNLFSTDQAAVAYAIASVNAAPTPVAVTADDTTNRFTYGSAHGIATGRAVLVGGVTAPAGTGLGVMYYARSVNSTNITLHPTQADAVANTNVIDITTTGSSVTIALTPFITLTAPYSGFTTPLSEYSISSDFTGFLNLPLLTVGDVNVSALVNRAMTLMDAALASIDPSIGAAPATITSSTTLSSQRFILASGNITLRPPSPTNRINLPFQITNVGTGTVTITPFAPALINGASTLQIFAKETTTIETDGANYFSYNGVLSIDHIITRTGRVTEAIAALGLTFGASTSVTTFGQSKTDGVATTYSRSDHTHGTPPLGTTSTTACAGNDSRLSNARTPLAHKTTHVSGGSDEIREATSTLNGLMSAVYAAKLDNIDANANNYVHPTGDGNLHVPATSTTNANRYLKAGATAGAISWDVLEWNDIANKPSTFLPIVGTISTHACAGNDSRLSNARTPVGTALLAGKVWVGTSGNIAAAVTMSGAVTISNTGVTALSASVIVPANFANAEPGALHTYDIDGLPIAIGPGLSGTVLKSAGTGYAPVWAPETSLAELNWIITSALHINVLPNTGYVLNKAALTFTVDSTTTDICTTSSAHGFLNGEQIVQVLTTGTRPGGLVAATAYYAGVTSTTKFKFYPTYADAIASTNPINITSIGSGVHSLGLRVELILPASCGAGKSIRIVSQGDPTWYLQQGAAHYCSYANNVTPVGTTGRVYSNDNRTNIEIVCTIANTRFQVTQVVGAITLDTPSVDPGYSGAGAALPMPFPPDPTYALATTTIKGAKSISSTSGGTLGANRTLELVGDDAAPGPLQYYGTNRASVKGFHALNGGALNVIDYGAVGNGTTNDYPAILDAYNALIALGGGTLYFPEGKTFAIKSAGVHGINIYQQSNVRIEFGKGAILLMDNLVSGNAVSHGIYVQGPCSNIEFVGVHVKYKTMNLVRSGWAPFYFLGANVGFGNEADPVGWSRGSYPGGTENPAGIAAGAVKNVIMRNCISENSPSTFLGIVGVDGITVNNFTGIKSWADGIYHLYFRNAMINNVKLYNVGDDAVSVASYESDKTNANIDNDFHGEGSIISSVYINGVWPLADYHPSGSVVVLGVRDLIFSNITAFDRYSGVRVENGTNSFDYPTLSLNFLACKNVSFDNLVLNNMVQTIRIISKECNLSTATKWWQSDILINGLSAKTMSDPIDVSSAGNNALPGGIMYGYRLLNCKFVGAVNAFSSVCQSYNCEFRNISSDSGFNFYGSVPYSSDPDQLKSGVPIFADNNCTITDLKGSSFLFQGLKNCYIDNIESLNAPSMGMTFASCADIRFGTLRVVNTNRTADANGGGVYIDRYCNRIMGDLIDCVHDNVAVANLVSNESIDTTKIRKVRNQTKLTGYYSRVSDRLWSTTRISSFESIEWYNSVNMPAWRRKVYETDRVLLLGDDALDFYPEDTPNIIIYNSAPLTVNRTITLYPDGASVGDRVRVARKSGCSGAFSLIVRTRPDAVSAIGEVLAFGSFMVTAGTPSGSTNRFTQVTVNGVNQLAAPVNCVEDGSHDNLQATAQAIVDAINITNLYVASRYRNVVSIKGKTGTGATPNGYVIAVTKAGNAAFDNVVPMGGGVTAAAGSAAGSFVTLTTGTISGVDRFADYRYTTTGWAYEAGNL